MTIWAWIGLSGIVIIALLPLLKEESRTKENILQAVVAVLIVLGILVAVFVFNISYFFAFLLAVVAFILFDKKTYTKKRLAIYGSIVLVIAAAGYSVLRDNPDYVLNHLKENPDSTSFYFAENGETLIAYQADAVRPLASTVKALIAVEYAMQVDEGLLNKDSIVPKEELDKYYYAGTDGNAHEAWLQSLEDAGTVGDEITLHDVAKGMITYSSNANTDYLTRKLGMDAINERAETLELTSHEKIYPLGSALLIPDYVENRGYEGELVDSLEQMPEDEYRELASELSDQLANGELDIKDYSFEMPLEVQRVWSDRLIGASANDYGKLLDVISSDELPATAAETVRDLMEWPMELNPGNQERFAHLGAKGGSTAFILNDAMYAEDLSGNKNEIVILMNDLNMWQSFMLGQNLNSFESNLLGSAEYREKVQQEISGS